MTSSGASFRRTYPSDGMKPAEPAALFEYKRAMTPLLAAHGPPCFTWSVARAGLARADRLREDRATAQIQQQRDSGKESPWRTQMELPIHGRPRDVPAWSERSLTAGGSRLR